MNKVAIIIVSLILAMAVVLSGCGGGYYSAPPPSPGGSVATPTAQNIHYTMPTGSITTSTVSYASNLEAGKQVTGFIRLTGTCPSIDWDSTCCFKVFDPRANTVYNWCGEFKEGGLRHDFSFTASYSGEYIIQVQHGSNHQRKLHIEISPSGWRKT